jgi:acyl carrier protein
MRSPRAPRRPYVAPMPRAQYEIAAAVRRIICEHLGVAEADAGDDVSLGAALGADSLDLIELEMRLEADLDIDIEDQIEASRDYTVGEVINLVQRAKEGGK